MADILLIAGTPNSGRIEHIDNLMHEAGDRALLLVPTRLYAMHRLEQLVLKTDCIGVWGRPVQTMEDFVTALLHAEGLQPVRLADFERRMLLNRVLDRLEADGVLEPLGSAARTNGFVTHMLRTITQLKQAAIEPAAFSENVRPRRKTTPVDEIVSAVYAGYQEALHDAGAYDLPGLFWQADLIALAKHPAVLEGIDSLLLDGFDDFTPSEFRLLTSLERHVERLVFGIDYDAEPERRDLFALPYRTIQTLQKSFPARHETYDTPTPQTCIDFASRHFMYRGTPSPSLTLERNVEFWMCADSVQETETVVRRVKTLLLQGVPHEAIAIIQPSLRATASAFRTISAEFGVPIRLMHTPTLWESAVSGFLVALFDALDDWSHAAVLDVLTSRWFLGGASESDAFCRFASMAQIVAGRSEWLQNTERLLARVEKRKGGDIERLCAAVPDADIRLRRMYERLKTLGGLADRLPRSAPLSAWPVWLDNVIDEIGIPEAVENHPIEAIRDYERAALAQLRDLLGRWAASVESDTPARTTAGFLALLRYALMQTPFPAPGARNGVAVLELASLRGLQFDHVFLVGANEGDIPAPAPANALYSEQDLLELARLGIELEGRRVHAEREALLFHRVFDAARGQLVISWHTHTHDGKERFPSPYSDDVRTLLEPVVGKPVIRSHFVPEPDEAASWRDICNLASDGMAALKPVVRRSFPQIESGMRTERARYDKRPFGVYDGVVSRVDIARRYDVNHVFSVSQLETYADCPFRFFIERVLDIEELERPQAEFDPRVRGQIMHKSLELLHRRYLGSSVVEWPEEELREAIRTSVGDAFEQFAWHSVTAPRGVMSVERERLCVLLERYVNIERENGNAEWKPTHIEVSFGDTRDSQDALCRGEPYLLHLEQEETIRVRGRIDRIDRRADAARIIDYKTSLPSLDLKSGRAMQLPVYAMALEGFLLPGTTCAEACFLPVGVSKPKEVLGRNKKTDEWPARRAAVLTRIQECIAGIREGRFPPMPADHKSACTNCPNRRACRYETTRIERKDVVL